MWGVLQAQGMCLVVGLVKDEVERLCADLSRSRGSKPLSLKQQGSVSALCRGKECAGKGETCQIAACLFSRAFSARDLRKPSIQEQAERWVLVAKLMKRAAQKP